jgi:WD40 repeat protein
MLQLRRVLSPSVRDWSADGKSDRGKLWHDNPSLALLAAELGLPFNWGRYVTRSIRRWLARGPAEERPRVTWLNAEESRFVTQSLARKHMATSIVAAITLSTMTVLLILTVWAFRETAVAQSESERAWTTLGNSELASGISARDLEDDPILATHHFLKARSSFAKGKDWLRCRNATLAARVLDPLVVCSQPQLETIVAFDVVFSRDGSHVVTSTKYSITSGIVVAVWDWREGAVRQARKFPTGVRAAWCSDDGTRYATIDDKGTITIRDVASGEPIRDVASGEPIRDVASGELIRNPLAVGRSLLQAWFIDGADRIVTCDSTGTSKVWKGGGVTQTTSIDFKDGTVRFHPNSPVVLVIPKDGARSSVLWDLIAGRSVRELSGIKDAIFDEGERRRLLAWDGQGGAELCDIDEHKPGPRLCHGSPIVGARFARSGSALITWSTSGSSTVAKVWGVSAGTGVVPIGTYPANVRIGDAIVNRDGTRILAWSGREALLWKVSDPKYRATFVHEPNNDSPSQALAGALFCSGDEQVATWMSWDSRIHVWDIPPRSETVNVPRLVLKHEKAHKGYIPIYVQATSPDEGSRILTWGSDDVARVWDLAGGAGTRLALERSARIVDATIGASLKYIAAWDEAGNARLWDVGRNQVMRVPIGNNPPVKKVVFKDGEDAIVAWRADGSALSWKIGGDESPAPIPAAPNRGELFAGADHVVTWDGEGRIAVLDPRSGALLGSVKHTRDKEDPRSVKAVALSRDGTTMLTCGFGYVAGLWRVSDGVMLQRFPHPASQGNGFAGAALNDDGTRAATLGIDVFCWTSQGREPFHVLPHSDKAGQLILLGAVFTGNGSRVLTWHWDGFARLWDFASGNLVRSFQQEIVRGDKIKIGAAVDRSGSLLLTVSESSMSTPARLWDVESGRVLRTFRAYGGTFSADGRYLLTFGDRGIQATDLRPDTAERADAEIDEFEVRSATELTASGEFRILTWPEWQQRKAKLDAARANRTPAQDEDRTSSQRPAAGVDDSAR